MVTMMVLMIHFHSDFFISIGAVPGANGVIQVTKMMNDKHSHVNMLKLFTHHYNGVLTDLELISWLSDFPWEMLATLPNACAGCDPDTGIKERALELKFAVENGEDTVIRVQA